MSWLVTEQESGQSREVFKRRVGTLAQGKENTIKQNSSTKVAKSLAGFLDDALWSDFIERIVLTMPTFKTDTNLQLIQRNGARNIVVCFCSNKHSLSACYVWNAA